MTPKKTPTKAPVVNGWWCSAGCEGVGAGGVERGEEEGEDEGEEERPGANIPVPAEAEVMAGTLVFCISGG